MKVSIRPLQPQYGDLGSLLPNPAFHPALTVQRNKQISLFAFTLCCKNSIKMSRKKSERKYLESIVQIEPKMFSSR
jgi:hypothetical protein